MDVLKLGWEIVNVGLTNYVGYFCAAKKQIVPIIRGFRSDVLFNLSHSPSRRDPDVM